MHYLNVACTYMGGGEPSAIHHQPPKADRDDHHNEDNDVGKFEITRLITECLDRYDNMGEGSGDDSIPCDMGNVEGAWVPSDDDSEAKDMSQLLEDSKIPLYNGCTTNWLVAILLLLNCFTIFGVSTAFANEMLKLMKELFLPMNSLPKSYYEAHKYMAKMGLYYNSIHACKNGCCLFWKDLKDVDKCPNYSESWYMLV